MALLHKYFQNNFVIGLQLRYAYLNQQDTKTFIILSTVTFPFRVFRLIRFRAFDRSRLRLR